MNEMMHSWGGHHLSAYETYKMAESASRRTNAGTVTALAIGGTTLALTVGGWIYANSRANSARDIANVQFAANNQQIAALTNLLATERSERVAQGYTITNTINDSVSGSQQGTLTAQQAAELSAVQTVQNNLFNQAVMGNMQQCPQKVAIWRDATACGCPGCGN